MIADVIIVFGLAAIGYAQYVQFNKIEMLEHIVGAVLLDLEEVEDALEEMLYEGAQDDA
jgi:hypothetical protein